MIANLYFIENNVFVKVILFKKKKPLQTNAEVAIAWKGTRMKLGFALELADDFLWKKGRGCNNLWSMTFYIK